MWYTRIYKWMIANGLIGIYKYDITCLSFKQETYQTLFLQSLTLTTLLLITFVLSIDWQCHVCVYYFHQNTYFLYFFKKTFQKLNFVYAVPCLFALYIIFKDIFNLQFIFNFLSLYSILYVLNAEFITLLSLFWQISNINH